VDPAAPVEPVGPEAPAPEAPDTPTPGATPKTRKEKIRELVNSDQLSPEERRVIAETVADLLPEGIEFDGWTAAPARNDDSEGLTQLTHDGLLAPVGAQASVKIRRRNSTGEILGISLLIENVDVAAMRKFHSPEEVVQRLIIKTRHEIAHALWKGVLSPSQKEAWKALVNKLGFRSPNMDHGDSIEEAWCDVVSVLDDRVSNDFRNKGANEGGLIEGIPVEIREFVNEILNGMGLGLNDAGLKWLFNQPLVAKAKEEVESIVEDAGTEGLLTEDFYKLATAQLLQEAEIKARDNAALKELMQIAFAPKRKITLSALIDSSIADKTLEEKDGRLYYKGEAAGKKGAFNLPPEEEGKLGPEFQLPLDPNRKKTQAEKQEIARIQRELEGLRQNLIKENNLPDFPLIRSQALLESVDPRLVQDLKIETETVPLTFGPRWLTHGVYGKGGKPQILFNSRWDMSSIRVPDSLVTATGKTKEELQAAIVDAVMGHEISHHLTIKRQQLDAKYLEQEARLFNSFRNGPAKPAKLRSLFLNELRKQSGIPGSGNVSTQKEFGNDIVNAIILGNLKPEAVKKAAEIASAAKPENVVQAVGQMAYRVTQGLKKFFEFMMAGAPKLREYVMRKEIKIEGQPKQKYDATVEAFALAKKALTFDESLDATHRERYRWPPRKKIERETDISDLPLSGDPPTTPAPKKPVVESEKPKNWTKKPEPKKPEPLVTEDNIADFFDEMTEDQQTRLIAMDDVPGLVIELNRILMAEEQPATPETPVEKPIEKKFDDNSSVFAENGFDNFVSDVKLQGLFSDENTIVVHKDTELRFADNTLSKPVIVIQKVAPMILAEGQKNDFIVTMYGDSWMATAKWGDFLNNDMSSESKASSLFNWMFDNRSSRSLRKGSEIDSVTELGEPTTAEIYLGAREAILEFAQEEFPSSLSIDDLYKAMTGGTRGKHKWGADRNVENQKFLETIAERALIDVVAERVVDLGESATLSSIFARANNTERVIKNIATPETRRVMQAFSTPPTIAVYAQLLGYSLSKEDQPRIYEPQFGTGSLMSLLAGANPVVGNELDPVRFELVSLGGVLPTELTNENSIEDPGPATPKPQLTIANPPFGNSPKQSIEFPIGQNVTEKQTKLIPGESPKRNFSKLEDISIAREMERLEDGGIGVFIFGAPGGPMLTEEDRKKGYSRTLFKLLRTHNIISHITVSGNLYKRMGTSYPVDVMVIQKLGKDTPKSEIIDPLMEVGEGILPPTFSKPTELANEIKKFETANKVYNDKIRRNLGRLGEFRDGLVPNRTGVQRGSIRKGVKDDPSTPPSEKPGSDKPTRRGGVAAGPTSRPGGKPGKSDPLDQPIDGGKDGPRIELPSGPEESKPEIPRNPKLDDGPERPGVDPSKPLDDDITIDDLDGMFSKEVAPTTEQLKAVGKYVVQAVNKGITKFNDFVQHLIEEFAPKGGWDYLTKRMRDKPIFAAALQKAWDNAAKLLKKKNVKQRTSNITTQIARLDPKKAITPEETTASMVDPDAIQTRYIPQSLATFPAEGKDFELKPADTLAPRNQAQVMIDALVRIEDATDMTIYDYVADRMGVNPDRLGLAFHAEQIDALAAAIYAAEKGQGFVIGDQTGVGKGRFVAGMLIYARRNGMFPVFMTMDNTLYTDMMRDIGGILESLGVAKIDEQGHKVQGAVFASSELVVTDSKRRTFARPFNENAEGGQARFKYILDEFLEPTEKAASDDKTLRSKNYEAELEEFIDSFIYTLKHPNMAPVALKGLPHLANVTMALALGTTYNQLKGEINSSNRRRLLKKIVDSGHAFFVLDEAHEASGGAGADPDSPHVGTFVSSLLANPLTKGTVYSSATFAKRPESLPVFMNAGLKHLSASERLLAAQGLKEMGLPGLTAYAQMLAEGGYYVRRQKSFEGISFNTTITEVDPAEVDHMAVVYNMVMDLAFDNDLESAHANAQQEIADSLGVSGRGPSGPKVSVRSGTEDWASTMYHLAAQHGSALKADKFALDVEESIKKGEAPFIVVEQTNEAALKRHLDKNKIKEGESFDFSYADLVMDRVDGLFRGKVTINDEEHAYTLEDSELTPRLAAEKKRITAEFTQDERMASLPAMAIDKVLRRLNSKGYNNAEITGRRYEINVLNDNGTLISVKPRKNKDKAYNVRLYNEGKAAFVLANIAGTTGFSAHARPGVSEKVRHQFIFQPLQDVAKFIQVMGRVNRYGQTQLPKYTLASSNIPFETKIQAMLAAKMQTLNASATAESKGAVSFDTKDIANIIGDMAAYEWSEENPGTRARMYLKAFPQPTLQKLVGAGENVRKLLNRLILLPMEEQLEILEDVSSRYDEIIGIFKKRGINPIASPIKDLQMRTISSMNVIPAVGDTVFEQGVQVDKVEVNILRTPPLPEDIISRMESLYGPTDNAGNPISYEIGVTKLPAERKFLEDADNWIRTAQRDQSLKMTELAVAKQELKDWEEANEDRPKDSPELKEMKGRIRELERIIGRSTDLIARVRIILNLHASRQMPEREIGEPLDQPRKERIFTLLNTPFAISQGNQAESAGNAIIVHANVTTQDPNDPMFWSVKNFRFELFGNEIGQMNANLNTFYGDVTQLKTEVDLAASLFPTVSNQEFVESLVVSKAGDTEYILVARGNLVRAMTELLKIKGKQMVFATKLDGSTERVLLLPQSVPSDFEGANTRILPRNLANLLTAEKPFKLFKLHARKGKSKYDGQIIQGPSENVVEVAIQSNARKVNDDLQLAAEALNFEVIRKTKSIVYQIDLSRGFDAVFDFAQAISAAGFEITVAEKNVEKYQEATGLGEMVYVAEEEAPSEELEAGFAKRSQMIRRRRASNRRGYVNIPVGALGRAVGKGLVYIVKGKRFRKNVADQLEKDRMAAFMSTFFPGSFMQMYFNNPQYSGALNTLRDAYDAYTEKSRRDVKNDNVQWSKLPTEWRNPEDTRFFQIMNHTIEPWRVKADLLTREETKGLEWSDEHHEAYMMLMEAPESVQDAFRYFRGRDEHMRLQMVTSIQDQRTAINRALQNQWGDKTASFMEKAEELELDWRLQEDSITILDGKGKDITETAARQMALIEVPTYSWGLRYGHVFHSWVGDFIVQYRRKDPETGEWSNYKNIFNDGTMDLPSRRFGEAGQTTRFQAEEVRENWLKVYPEDEVLISENSYYPSDILRLSKSQVREVEKNLRMQGLTSAEASAAKKGVIGQQQYKAKFYDPFLKRGDGKGYTQDYMQVWQTSVIGFHRWQELTKANFEVVPVIERMVSNRQPNMAADLQDRLNFLWTGKQPGVLQSFEEFANATIDALAYQLPSWTGVGGGKLPRNMGTAVGRKYREMFYAANLSWSIKGSFVNLSQIPVFVAAELGYKNTLMASAQILRNPRRSLSILRQHGTYSGRGTWEDGTVLGAEIKRYGMNVPKTTKAVMAAAWKKMMELNPFSLTEQLNQNATFLIGFYDAKRRGGTEAYAVEHARTLRFATQYPYNAAEIAGAWRTQTGMTIGQFRRFAASQVGYAVGNTFTKGGSKSASRRWLMGVWLYGGIRALLPNTFMSLVGLGYYAQSDFVHSMILSIIEMMGFGSDGDEPEDRKEKLRSALEKYEKNGTPGSFAPEQRSASEYVSDLITFGVISVLFDGEFNISDSMSPYPVFIDQKAETLGEGVTSVLADLAGGAGGRSAVEILNAATRTENPYQSRVESAIRSTGMGRTIYELVRAIDGETRRTSRSGNLVMEDTTRELISRAMNFTSTRQLKESQMVSTLNYMIAEERAHIQGIAVPIAAAIDAYETADTLLEKVSKLDQVRIALKEAIDHIKEQARFNAYVDAEGRITNVAIFNTENERLQDKVGKAVEGWQERRKMPFLLRAIKNADDALASRWFDGLDDDQRLYIVKTIQAYEEKVKNDK